MGYFTECAGCGEELMSPDIYYGPDDKPYCLECVPDAPDLGMVEEE